MADRDYGWRDRDFDENEGRYGREGFRGPNREGINRGGPSQGARGGYGGYGDYGEFRGYGPYGEYRGYGGAGGFGGYGREYGGRYGAGYGGETGWDRDLERSRDFDRNREFGSNRDFDRYGNYGGYGTSSSRFYGSSWDRGTYGGYGDRQGTAIGRPNHTGRGPKNWRRSDERITEEINERLARDPDIDATDVDVRVNSGVVTLSGVVEDRGEKRRAEDLAEVVFGVDDVSNELKVRHGFLSRLTGEHVDEREVTRSAERDTSSTTSGTSAGSRTSSAARTTTSRT